MATQAYSASFCNDLLTLNITHLFELIAFGRILFIFSVRKEHIPLSSRLSPLHIERSCKNTLCDTQNTCTNEKNAYFNELFPHLAFEDSLAMGNNETSPWINHRC